MTESTKTATVTCYVETAHQTEPARSAYGIVLEHAETGKRLGVGGNCPSQSDNYMKIHAVKVALKHLSAPSRVTVICSSRYAVDGWNTWLDGWRQRGWVTSNGKPVANRELWEQLLQFAAEHEVILVSANDHNPEEDRNEGNRDTARYIAETVLPKEPSPEYGWTKPL